MKNILLFILVTLSFLCTTTYSEENQNFDYEQQVGVYFRSRYIYKNRAFFDSSTVIQPGVKLNVLTIPIGARKDEPEQFQIKTKAITEKLPEFISLNGKSENLQIWNLENEKDIPIGDGIAVIGKIGDFKATPEGMRIDLDQDGKFEYLYSCLTGEAFYLIIRAGKSRDSKKLWRAYIPVGYDMPESEYSCQECDLENE